MGRMVRKQIYLKPDQESLLKQRSTELGVSEAELIRQYVETGLGKTLSGEERERIWQEEIAFMKQRAASLPDLKGKRTWTREDAYEERLERYSR